MRQITETHKKLAILMFRICDLLNLPFTLDVAEFMGQLYTNGHLSHEQLKEWLKVLGVTETEFWRMREKKKSVPAI